MRRVFMGLMALGAALFPALEGCGGSVSPSVGSETNWIGGCERDDQCTRGRCVCGLCTDACDDNTACPGSPGAESCVTRGSNPFGSTCDAAADKPAGVCLQSCTTDTDCTGAYLCETGACVPVSPAPSSGSPMSTAQLEQVKIGAACIPSDERNPDFPGFGATEVNISDHDPDCASGTCLVKHFQGRVTCAYGQPADSRDPTVADPSNLNCPVFGSTTYVTVPVEPQLVSQRPDVAVYCSCRCDGPDGTGPFCACPSGFECTALVANIGERGSASAGSYCVKAGTAVSDPAVLSGTPACSAQSLNCGPGP